MVDITDIYNFSILENAGTLKYVPDCCKNQELYNKAVDSYHHALEVVPECYKALKMCDKAVSAYPSTIKLVFASLIIQEMYEKAVSRCFLYFIMFLINIKLKKCMAELLLKILFIVYFPDKHITEKIHDEAFMIL